MDHKAYLLDPGIKFINNRYYFNKNNQVVTDSKTLTRLMKYKPPPAWNNVWYSSKPRCHIQVYGTDVGGKKQYILSEEWVKNSKSEKFNRMKKFIKSIHGFKKKIKLEKVIINHDTIVKLLFNLLIDLHIRVGNEIYVPNSYGLTTLRQKHLRLVDNHFQFKFIGKSGIEHTIPIPEIYTPWFWKLKNENKNAKLFQEISSDELNVFLKQNMGKEYTCKDFRTYSANMLFIKSFLKNSKRSENPKKIVLRSIDDSAQQLGHTRSISRKSYISENLVDYCIDSFQEASQLSSINLLLRT